MKLLFIGWNLLMLLALLSGIASVGELPAATSEAERAGAALGATLGVGMLLTFWMAGSVILGLLVLFTRGRTMLVPIDR